MHLPYPRQRYPKEEGIGPCTWGKAKREYGPGEGLGKGRLYKEMSPRMALEPSGVVTVSFIAAENGTHHV